MEAAWVDGQIVPEERDYLRAIANALELPEAELDKRIAQARS
jgi:tellurite resistance protein